MEKLNVVIDTNVIIAALRSKRGSAYKLLITLVEDLYLPNISVPLFVEYESVAKRQGMLEGLGNEDIEAILDYVLSKSSIRKIFYLWRPFLKDPKDDFILELAVESQSEFIITYNKNDFKGIEKFGVRALTPKELLKKIGEI